MIRATALAIAFCLSLAAASGGGAVIRIEPVTSPGGIYAWLVNEPSIPFVALKIGFRGGASLDPPGKRGGTNLMTSLLSEGAGELDSRTFAERAQSLSTRISFSVNNGGLMASAHVLDEFRDQSVELLRLALSEPRFDQPDINRVRNRVIAGIRMRESDPVDIAITTFNSETFGDHPYGVPMQGSQETLATLTREDLLSAHGATIARDRMYVSAVGNITAGDLGVLLDRLLGELPAEGAPMAPRAKYHIATGGIRLVPFDTPQSVAMFGHAGIPESDPDFLAAFVVNSIMGRGLPDNRLYHHVREQRGLAYNVSSHLVTPDLAELIVGQVATSNERVAETISVIRQQWEQMAEKGVSEDELARAKSYLMGAWPLRFSGNGRIAAMLTSMQMAGRPIEYVNERNALVDAITVHTANRAARRLFQPDDLYFVVVGQPEGVSSIEEWGRQP